METLLASSVGTPDAGVLNELFDVIPCLLTSCQSFRRHDVFLTSWFLTSWRVFDYDEVFDVMVCLLTSWHIFYLFLTLWRTFWRRHDLFLKKSSWRNFWRHDGIFDVMTCVDVMTNYLTLWRTCDVMMNFLASWRTFWHHNIFWMSWQNVSMSWSIFEVMTNF